MVSNTFGFFVDENKDASIATFDICKLDRCRRLVGQQYVSMSLYNPCPPNLQDVVNGLEARS